MTVLQLLPSLEGGGVERGTLEVAHHLVRQGHRSLVISAGGRLVSQLEREGTRHFAWPIGRKSLMTFRLVGQLRQFLIQQRVDVLHLRSRLPAWIGYLAWRSMDPQTRPRLVTTAHGFYSPGFYSSVMLRGERVIAVSESMARYLQSHFSGWRHDALRVIPRGIDPQIHYPGFTPAATWIDDWLRQYPRLRGKRLVVLPGRITRLKGHHEFIRLIAELRRQQPDLHGLIVGEAGPGHHAYLAEIELEIERLGLRDAITLTGHRGDLREIFSISALVVSLSTQPEAFGRTVLEALALGMPVAGYAHGGVGEVLGAMFPQGRVASGDFSGLLEASSRCLAGQFRPGPLPVQFELGQMLESTLSLYREIVLSIRTENSSCCSTL